MIQIIKYSSKSVVYTVCILLCVLSMYGKCRWHVVFGKLALNPGIINFIMVQQTKSIICFVKDFSGINVYLFHVYLDKKNMQDQLNALVSLHVLVRLAAVQNENSDSTCCWRCIIILKLKLRMCTLTQVYFVFCFVICTFPELNLFS